MVIVSGSVCQSAIALRNESSYVLLIDMLPLQARHRILQQKDTNVKLVAIMEQSELTHV